MGDILDGILGEPSAVRTKSKSDAASRLADLDRQLGEHLHKSELDKLVSATSGVIAAFRDSGGDDESDEDDRVSLVTGRPAATQVQIASAYRANLLRGFRLRRRVLDDTFSASEVAEMLGAASRQTAHDRAREGRLLAIKDNGRVRFPAWQFDPESPDGVLAGLPEVIAVLPEQTPIARALWFLTPKQQLGGRTPLDALRAGDIDPVVAEAQAAKGT